LNAPNPNEKLTETVHTETVNDGHQMPEVRNLFGLKAVQSVLVLFVLFLLSRHAHWTVVLSNFLIFILIGILFRSVWRLAKEVRSLSRTDNKDHRGSK
jgi:hypothetical protein